MYYKTLWTAFYVTSRILYTYFPHLWSIIPTILSSSVQSWKFISWLNDDQQRRSKEEERSEEEGGGTIRGGHDPGHDPGWTTTTSNQDRSVTTIKITLVFFFIIPVIFLFFYYTLVLFIIPVFYLYFFYWYSKERYNQKIQNLLSISKSYNTRYHKISSMTNIFFFEKQKIYLDTSQKV